MREYELTVVFDLALAEADGQDAGPNVITNVVQARQGSVVKVDHWGRRRMAYPINGMLDADYVVTRVMLDPTNVREVETALKMNERVLRHLVVRADELPVPRMRDEPPPRPAGDGAGAPATAAPAAPAPAAAPETAAAPVAEAVPEATTEPTDDAAPEGAATPAVDTAPDAAVETPAPEVAAAAPTGVEPAAGEADTAEADAASERATEPSGATGPDETPEDESSTTA